MTAIRDSRTRFALMGLLTIGPMTGYEMRKFIEKTISHFWRESFGNIYPILRRLRSEGLVSCKTQRRSGRPGRQVYRLTSKGRTLFRSWLIEPTAREQIKSELLLKLFFGSHMPLDSMEKQLRDYERQQQELLRVYKDARTDLVSAGEADHGRMFWMMTLRRGELLTRARLRWSRECLKTIKQMATDSGTLEQSIALVRKEEEK